MKRQVLASIIALAWVDAGWSELTATPPTATSIVPDVVPGRSLGTTTSTVGPVTTIDGGTVAGNNLFHSFSTFDLAVGDTAAWTYSAGDPASIGNVVNRVTGGSPSQLFGTLDSTALPNADFFFINPAGIVFGDGAQVNVPAAAHFSTASNLNFDNGDTFAIATPDGSTLSVAAPSAFGFIGSEGDILMSGAGRTKYGSGPEFSPGAASIHLSGHDISLVGSGIRATGISLAAVGDMTAIVPLDGHVDGLLGKLVLSDYSYLNSAEPGSGGYQSFLSSGDVILRAGELSTNLAFIDSYGYDGEHAGSVDIGVTGHADMFITDIYATGAYGSDGGDITLHAGSADLTRVTFASGTYWGEADNRGGDISVTIDDALTMLASGFSTENWSPGTGGSISVSATSLSMNASEISVDSPYGGNGGDITVTVDELLSMQNFSSIYSSGSAAGGPPYGFPGGTSGSVNITAGDLVMFSDPSPDYSTFSGGGWIASVGTEGDLNINVAGSISMNNGAAISASGSVGQSGEITMSAAMLSLDQRSSISSDTAAGEAGGVSLSIIGGLTLNNSGITSESSGSGIGGDLIINAGSAILAGGSEISSDATWNGQGGLVNVSVGDTLTLTDKSRISSSGGSKFDHTTTGNAGAVTVAAKQLNLSGESEISSRSFASGNAGTVSISANDAVLLGSLISSSSRGVYNSDTGDFPPPLNGDAGSVFVDIDGNLSLTFSEISSDSDNGQAGSVDIQAGSVDIHGAQISSTAYGDGVGGNVTLGVESGLEAYAAFIMAESKGAGNSGNIVVEAESLDFSMSNISSASTGNGDSGSIFIEADSIVFGSLDDTANVSDITTTSFYGDAGKIEIVAHADFQLGYLGWIASETVDGTAGSIFIDAAEMSMGSGSQVGTSTYGDGMGGDTHITVAGDLTMAQAYIKSSADYGANGDAGLIDLQIGGNLVMYESMIAVDSSGDGTAGSIFIRAHDANLGVASEIRSIAHAAGDAGFVDIALTGDLTLDDYAAITSESWYFADAGDVFVSARDIALSNNSQITSAAREDGNAGTVTVEATGNLSLTDASFIQTNAGSEYWNTSDGAAGFVSVSAADISLAKGSAIKSQSFGFGPGGDVEISTPGQLSMSESFIASDAFGDGDAGFISIQADSAEMAASLIRSASFGAGDAGYVDLNLAGELTLDELSRIDTASFGNANAGDIFIKAQDINLFGIIASNAPNDGNGGTVEINAAGRFSIDGGHIVTSAGQVDSGPGYAGLISITADELVMSNFSNITSGVGEGVGGSAGSIFVEAPTISLTDAQITTNSRGARAAGTVTVIADQLSLDGETSMIGSQNINEVSAAENVAGSVFVEAQDIRITNGARISTNSLTGVAGSIDISMPNDGLLIMSGEELPGVIETSSGPGLGGVISIASPLAIISNGGSILALGESGGANVQIDTQYFITSSDRPNIVAVDGTLSFTNSIYDVSSGTVDADLAPIDASGVLRGQCSAVRSTGSVSQLNVRAVGPYGASITTAPPPAQSGSAAAVGGCL